MSTILAWLVDVLLGLLFPVYANWQYIFGDKEVQKNERYENVLFGIGKFLSKKHPKIALGLYLIPILVSVYVLLVTE